MGCRFLSHKWKDENGVEVNSGRMKIWVLWVNLPLVLLLSLKVIYMFWEIFNTSEWIAQDALVFRVSNALKRTHQQMLLFFISTAFLARV